MTVRQRYLLLQVPGWIVAAALLAGLYYWGVLPLWVCGLVFLLDVAKDFVLYPYLRRAYESNVKTGVEQLVGTSGIAQEALDPEGYVLVNGELWKAFAEPPAPPIPAGSRVQVQAAQGLTLRVAAIQPSSHGPSSSALPRVTQERF